jgi:hypothetical protein
MIESARFVSPHAETPPRPIQPASPPTEDRRRTEGARTAASAARHRRCEPRRRPARWRRDSRSHSRIEASLRRRRRSATPPPTVLRRRRTSARSPRDPLQTLKRSAPHRRGRSGILLRRSPRRAGSSARSGEPSRRSAQSHRCPTPGHARTPKERTSLQCRRPRRLRAREPLSIGAASRSRYQWLFSSGSRSRPTPQAQHPESIARTSNDGRHKLSCNPYTRALRGLRGGHRRSMVAVHDATSVFGASLQSTLVKRPAAIDGARNVFLACSTAASSTG